MNPTKFRIIIMLAVCYRVFGLVAVSSFVRLFCLVHFEIDIGFIVIEVLLQCFKYYRSAFSSR